MNISFKWRNSLFVRLAIILVILTIVIAIFPVQHAFTQMTETRSPTTNIVIDGNARFTVLTPMVIRLEYANDGNFQNGTTFNVINRTFPIPNYSTQVVNGWREISTNDLTLRYKEGSGMFSPTNLTMLLKGRSERVIPDWGQAIFSPCTFAQNCETENAFLSGGTTIATDHQNHTGIGFVAGYQQSGSSATWVLHDSALASTDTLSIRYANATGGDGLNETRTLDLYVNGTNTGPISFPTTANWDSWSTVKQTVKLQKGDNTLALICDTGNSCNINVDSTIVSEVCVLGQICQAENAAFSGGASIASNHQAYTGSGFVAGYEQSGATTTWTVQAVPQAGNAVLTIRYANFLGSDNQTTTRTLGLYVNGSRTTQLSFAPTMSWDSWQTVTQTVALAAGNNTIALAYDASDTGKINLDSIAITPPRAALPLMTPANMGGWERALDGANGGVTMNNGLLSQDGWYLLDDTSTALWNGAKSWPAPRPSHSGAYQDGYFFGYGHQYEAALRQLAQLTGATPLLPRWAFGNWYSRYYPYTANDYEQTVLPKFRSEQVPLDVLVTDTDWKAPASWNGWNWNTSDFPDPQAYLTWAKSQGLHVTLNIHPSIQGDDPQFAATNSAAGGLINDGSNRYVWDWSNQQQATSYFALHQPFDQQGVRFWWLDWCCDNSRVSMSGLNPDGWINYLYAQDAINQNLRGFAFSRMGSTYNGYAANSATVPGGPWSNHRSTVQFTGDTNPSWDMLSFEAAFSTMEGNIGQAYVTHDIGSFHGNHLADDLYVRWIQFGTFQPILRLHSDHGDRLPWNYDDTARVPAEQFMRLRESLIPYLYTLSWQAATTGLPMTRGLYLTYPEAPEAYQYDREYMLGDQMLVAPITSAGTTASTRVWLPPGAWTDYFTGKSYAGPSVQTITDNLSQMPVFIKAGGIIPTQPYMDYANQKPVDPLNLSVYAGARGTYTLYEDSGEGLSYQKGQSALTTISYNQSSLDIGAEQGSYAGQLSQRSYNIAIINVASAPSRVTINGQPLSQAATGEGWTYDATAHTAHIQLNKRSTHTALNIQLS